MSTYDWSSFNPQETAVLCFVRRNGDVLLIHKKRGLGAGKINGPGGRLEAGETPRDAAIRETHEEVGLRPEDPIHHGTLSFVFTDGYHLLVHVYVAHDATGEVMETDEAAPFWQPTDSIPFDRMWADDRLWLPHVLEGRTIDGKFLFDGDAMLEWHLTTR